MIILLWKYPLLSLELLTPEPQIPLQNQRALPHDLILLYAYSSLSLLNLSIPTTTPKLPPVQLVTRHLNSYSSHHLLPPVPLFRLPFYPSFYTRIT